MELLCLCDDWVILVQFLKHPTEVQHHFKVDRSRRWHIHEQLENSGVDATDTTECVGKPNTVMVTRSNASYEKDVKKHQRDKLCWFPLRLCCQPWKLMCLQRINYQLKSRKIPLPRLFQDHQTIILFEPNFVLLLT